MKKHTKRLGVIGATAAIATAVGALGLAAPASATAGEWDYIGWYQYKSTCDAEGKKLVNQDKHDAYTDWRCWSDSPGYNLYIFQKYGA